MTRAQALSERACVHIRETVSADLVGSSFTSSNWLTEHVLCRSECSLTGRHPS